MANNSDSKLLCCSCLLVDNIEVVSNFFSQVFEGCTIDTHLTPIQYAAIRISHTEDGAVLIIQKASCSPAQLGYFRSVSTSKQLFIVVKDPAKVLKGAIAAGGQVGESCVDDNGSIYCAFDGPEIFSFKVMNSTRNRRLSVHEMILSGAFDSEDSIPQGSSTAHHRSAVPQSPPRARRIPRAPRIPTLDVSILSNGTKKEYVPCPANSREPIPFETELFKGTALLVVRTKPPDGHFDSFFNGPKK